MNAKAGVLPIPKAAPAEPEREAQYVFPELPAEVPECFLAQFAPEVPCAGRMEKAHLIRAQTIRREVSRARLVVWDPRVWRPACFRHHVMLDQTKTLVVPRSAIPAETEQWARENGLAWWLERTYGAHDAPS